MKSNRNQFLLISPCRNEASFMRRTLDSVLAQTFQPTLWIIVDDGSTDDTAKILQEYQRRVSWIHVITRSDRGHRAVGPGVIDAFYAAYDTVSPGDYEFFCKLDLDLDLPPRYFEILIGRMNEDSRIATCSGKAYIDRNSLLVSERHGDDTSLGMTKLYRMTAFREIGGFVREVMWDGIDCHRCRMLGWKACSWDEPDLRFTHLRPMGSSQQNILVGRARHGFGQYYMGTGFLYLVASAIVRLNERPVIVGSIAVIWGWLQSAAARKSRYEDPEFRRYLRDYQRKVLLFGKRKALKLTHNANVHDDYSTR